VTESELAEWKEWLRGKLRKEPNEESWHRVVRREVVTQAAGDAKTNIEQARADVLAAYLEEEQTRLEVRALRGRKKARSREIPPDLRADFLAKLLAQRAERFDYVRNFRREVLKGHLLKARADNANVHGWIRTQAKRDGDATWWERKKPAVAGWPEESESVPETLAYLSEEGVRRWPIRVDGRLGHLSRVAQALVREFPAWSEAWAVQFVLTGERPPASKGRVTARIGDLPAFDSITIEVSPRVSLSELSSIYREVRAEVIGEGERSRADVGEHRLKLGIFADAHNDGRRWQDAMDAWNREHPEERRYSDPKRFARDCAAGYKAITGERLAWGGTRREEPADSNEIGAAIEVDKEGHMRLRSPDDKTGE
jgi:hypothetical protein